MDEIKPEDEESIHQDKYKVSPTELKLVKNTVDQLDIILTILNNDEVKPYSIHKIKYHVTRQKLKIPDKDLQLSVDKLCDDKHVLLIENFDGRSPVQKYQDIPVAEKSYRITYSGRFFLNNVSQKYVNQPYKYSNAILRRSQIYTSAKIAANVASTLIIIIIGAIGVYVTDKSNKLEQTIDEQRIKSEKQERKIDSLIKLTTDTIRLKKN